MLGAGAAALCLGLVVSALLPGCARSAGDDPRAKLDPALRSLATTQPDSVAGVLVRLDAPLDAARRDSLHERGLEVRSQAGDVLTGTVRAAAAVEVARLPFVVRIELARPVPMHRSTL